MRRWPGVVTGTAARRVVAERGSFAVSLGFYAVVTSVVSALWRTAAAGHGGEIAGYSGAALTWYIMASEAVIISLNVRLIEDIGNEIGDGSIAAELLRPAPVLWVRLATEVGRALPRLFACLAVGSALAFLLVGGPPRAASLPFAVPAVVLAIANNLIAQHAFASISFWIRDARSTWYLYQKLVFILGGMLLPLQVMPGPLRAVAFGLPFMTMSYVPARLYSGHVEPWLIPVQLVWLVVLALLCNVAFTRGERRLQVVGG